MLKNNKIKLPLYLLLTFTAINCDVSSKKEIKSTTKTEEQSIKDKINLLKAEAKVLQAKIKINKQDNDSIKGVQEEDSIIYTDLQPKNPNEYTRLKELSEFMIAEKNIASNIKSEKDKLAKIQGIFPKIGSFVNIINHWDNNNFGGFIKASVLAATLVAVYSYLTKNEENKELEENNDEENNG